MEQQINPDVIIGLLAVAIIGGISLAAKDTISNIWAALSFMLNPVLRKGKIIEVKVQDQVLRGKLRSFSLTRAVMEEENGDLYLILTSELKKVNIKVLAGK